MSTSSKGAEGVVWETNALLALADWQASAELASKRTSGGNWPEVGGRASWEDVGPSADGAAGEATSAGKKTRRGEATPSTEGDERGERARYWRVCRPERSKWRG